MQSYKILRRSNGKSNSAVSKAGNSSADSTPGVDPTNSQNGQTPQAQSSSITDILLTPWRWALNALGL